MSSPVNFYGATTDIQTNEHDTGSQITTSQVPPRNAFCRQQSLASVASGTIDLTKDSNTKKSKDRRLIKGKKDVLVIISMALTLFFGLCAFSVIAPFFTLEGEKKGVSTSITGLIFATYPLVVFLLCPVVGKFMPVIGPKFCLIAGTFLEGGTQILFGFVEDISDKKLFLTYCFVIRIVTAMGSACSQTAILSVMSMTFRENMATIFGMLELFSGLGLMAGPAIGGVLYKIGGFKLPFIVVGGVLLLADIIIFFVLPTDEALRKSSSEDDENADEKADNEKIESVSGVIRVPGIFMLSIVTITAGTVLSFLDPTLTPHLQDVSHNTLGSEKIGLFFLISGGLYTICSPPLGYLTDTKLDGRYTIIFGHIIVFAAYFFLGPSPLTSSFIKPHLWLVAVSLALIGIGIAPFVVPSLADMTLCASNAGLPDNLGIKSILSGIFGSCFSIGSVIGPTLGGFLTDHLSFDWASTIFSFIVLFEGIVLLFFTIWERNSRWYKKKKRPREDSETEALLPTV